MTACQGLVVPGTSEKRIALNIHQVAMNASCYLDTVTTNVGTISIDSMYYVSVQRAHDPMMTIIDAWSDPQQPVFGRLKRVGGDRVAMAFYRQGVEEIVELRDGMTILISTDIDQPIAIEGGEGE